MKKIKDFIKPYLLIIFGALFLLLYSNLLDGGTAEIVFGVFAIIFAVYYIVAGVIKIVATDKFEENIRNILDFFTYSLFPFFMLGYGIYTLIDQFDFIAVTMIIIWFLIVISALLLIVFQAFAKLGNGCGNNKGAFLFSALFIISWALLVLFENTAMALFTLTIGFVIEVIFVTSFALILLENKVDNKSIEENVDKPAQAKNKQPKQPKEEPKEEAVAE